jgi:tripartite motif-containing protein 71
LSIVNAHVYVSDTVNHRLQAFDLNGKLYLIWGRHPETIHEGNGHTHYPSAIKVSPDGSIAVVCEPFEYRCQIFEMQAVQNRVAENTNAWWEKFPRFHYGGGARIARPSLMENVRASLQQLQAVQRQQLQAVQNRPLPTRIPKEMLVITEPDLHRVVAFSLDTPMHELSLRAQAAGSSSAPVPLMYSIGSFGHGPGQFAMLAGKRPMLDGSLLVGDAGNNNMQQFRLLTGQYMRTLFGPGSGPGQFHGPSGIAETPDGKIYIGDFHNNRIQVFDKDYHFQFAFGELGDGSWATVRTSITGI